ncbi:hypothetical protein CMI37_14155 [Candidatus Pacearchaeota archaeon]|nr:hypothetical protein [Candidatus Pacearchaeota archaeon]|tara:strand:- start:2827 stop:3069 length:243 start_codon:yes stop_codon:yes gene_type:complete
MPILRKHIEKIDELKDEITDDAEKILDIVDIDLLFKMDKEEINIYTSEILYQYWESKQTMVEEAIGLGEKKAKKIINAID